jgi:hypothetical protein
MVKVQGIGACLDCWGIHTVQTELERAKPPTDFLEHRFVDSGTIPLAAHRLSGTYSAYSAPTISLGTDL